MKKIMALFSIILSAAAWGYTVDKNYISDSRGNRIERKEYKKIVVMDPAVVESFYLIEGEDKIAAIADVAKSKIWPEEKTSKLESAGNMMKPSIEKVITFSPDLVILNEVSSGFGESLGARGIKYIINEGKTFDEILDNLEVYGILTGKAQNAQEVKAGYEKKLMEIEKSIKENPLNLRGVFIYSTSPMMVFTGDSLPGEIFRTLGIKNIADTLPGKRPILSPEFLVQSNPEIIVGSMGINSPEDVTRSNPMVGQTVAGKTNNIRVLDSTKILRATPRIIDALEELHKEIAGAK